MFKIFYKYRDLIEKIINTLFMVFIYRIGSHVNLPGVNPNILTKLIEENNGLFSNLNLFLGGSMAKGTIFCLGPYPLISAQVVMQVLTSDIGIPYLINLKKQQGTGQEKIQAYTKYLTIIIGLFHGIGYCTYIVTQKYQGISAVYLPKTLFFFIALTHMIAGLMFLIWLGNQITQKGICNGISLLIFTGIVSNIPKSIEKCFALLNSGNITVGGLLLFALFVVAVMMFGIFTETSKRNISVRYPHSKLFETTGVASNHFLPLKINNASIMPSIMAAAIIMAPNMIQMIFNKINLNGPVIDKVFLAFGRGEPLYYVIYGLAIVAFTIIYTPMVFSPQSLSDPLKKSQCVLENWRPGVQTSMELSSIIKNLSYIAAGKLLLLCVGVEFILTKSGAPMILGGTAIMICCSVALEIYDSYLSHSSSHESVKVLNQYALGELYNKKVSY